MNGCRHEDAVFTVAVTDLRGSRFCSRCGIAMKTSYKYNGERMCRACFDKACPDKEIGVCKVDAFSEIVDKDLGASYTSMHQKRRIMKKKGIAYAEDFKQNRDIGKDAEFKFGKRGDRKMGVKKWV